MICKICSNSENNNVFLVKEMMLGLGDEFPYFECSSCGCLQIAQIPNNMSKYYPPEYLSFKKSKSKNPIRKILRNKKNRYALLKKGFIGSLLHTIYPNPILDSIGKTDITLDSRILDVGCGTAGLLRTLHDLGLRNLIGLEPHAHMSPIDHVDILRITIHELPNSHKFDLVIFNHSFEHIPDQLETLVKVSRILSQNGTCILRMPIKTEFIWNLYGTNWVQIDAPRHFFIHSLESFNLLVQKAGLAIRDFVFDSTEFQFRGSEQYMRNIPLKGKNSYSVTSGKSIFTVKKIKEFRKIAEQLNKNRQGDQATFYLNIVRK